MAKPHFDKRTIDLSIAIVVIGYFTLIALAVVAAVKLSSRGLILYGQEKIRYGCVPFRMWKFFPLFDSMIKNFNN